MPLEKPTFTPDSYTGLDYASQRFYASTYGRFNSPDPAWTSVISESSGTWNRYPYVAGDPINHHDPNGLDPCSGQPSNLDACSFASQYQASSSDASGSGTPSSCDGFGGPIGCNCDSAVVHDPECMLAMTMNTPPSLLPVASSPSVSSSASVVVTPPPVPDDSPSPAAPLPLSGNLAVAGPEDTAKFKSGGICSGIAVVSLYVATWGWMGYIGVAPIFLTPVGGGILAGAGIGLAIGGAACSL